MTHEYPEGVAAVGAYRQMKSASEKTLVELVRGHLVPGQNGRALVCQASVGL